MSKRTSGLGRGLGDLLADNSPEIRGGATVIRRDEDGEATITPDVSDGVGAQIAAEAQESYGKDEKNIKNQETETQVLKENANVSAENTQTRIIIGGSSYTADTDPYATSSVSDPSLADTRPAHRSLKALFKSYK